MFIEFVSFLVVDWTSSTVSVMLADTSWKIILVLWLDVSTPDLHVSTSFFSLQYPFKKRCVAMRTEELHVVDHKLQIIYYWQDAVPKFSNLFNTKCMETGKENLTTIKILIM